MDRVIRPLALLAGLVLLLSSCRAPSSDTGTFLLRTAHTDVVAASDKLTDLVFRQLQAGGALPEGYPVQGHVVTEPNPSDPGVEVMSCSAGSSGKAGETRCILLSEDHDFIRVQPVTWQSAAPYINRIYIAPRLLVARVDPAKNFVALDVFGPGNLILWQPVEQAIRNAAAELGARPFRP
jgi:hypothetical protein